MTRRSTPGVRHNVALILGAFAFFSVVGFFLPFVVMYGADSIAATLNPNAGPVQSPQVPMELSVYSAALIGTGAAVGLTLRVVSKRSRSASARRRA